MDENCWLAERFEAHRAHLRAVAYRMLGSLGEAEDAVQESWLHLSRADTSGVDNLGGWLTTVVARVCLDMLRSRKARREEPMAAPDPAADRKAGTDPEREAVLADSVGLARLVVHLRAREYGVLRNARRTRALSRRSSSGLSSPGRALSRSTRFPGA
ncbi:sigma factor [Sorangium sp. So ce1153]